MNRLLGKRVYLESNVFIYFLQQDPQRFAVAAELVDAAHRGRFAAVTGDAVVAEVMVLPYRSADTEMIERVRAFFDTPRLFDIRTHRAPDFDAAARLRGERRLSMMDALHLATAVNSSCEYFVTNDSRIPDIEGVAIVRLSDLVSGE